MRLVQNYLSAHFQFPLMRQLLILGNYERQVGLCGTNCIIQHSRGVSAMVRNFPIEYAQKLIRGDLQGVHSRRQLCGEGRQSWDNIQITTCLFF